MTLVSRTICGAVLLLCCLAVSHCNAQGAGAPVYSRQRTFAVGDVGARGDGARSVVGEGNLPIAGHYPGYYRGHVQQPFIVGSWYARPYPYHFDYYRQRYRGPPQTTDCPCAAAPLQQ